MPRIRDSIPNLITGVSQQPPAMRLPTSVESAENAYLSVVSGNQKRPPSDYVGPLAAGALTNAASVHLVRRDEGYKYTIIATNGGLQVFDLADGSAKTVTLASGTASYLAANNPVKSFRFATVGDTTFVLNRNIKVVASDITEASLTGADARIDPYSVLSVFIKKAVPSTTFAIYVDGTLEATFSTSDNTTAGTALEGTAEIAQALVDDAITKGNTNVGRVGSTLFFDVPVDSVVTVDEQFGGDAMTVIQDRVNDFADLPPSEQAGRLIKVVGDPDEEGDDYWVVFDGRTWVETFGYNAGRELDASTMPHILVDNRDGTLDFTEAVWPARTVGDSESNSDPTVVGNRINGICLFKGRMGFLADENLLMSETANFENLWRTTVAQLIDTDRIDVASNTGAVNILQHWVAFSKKLLVTSEKQQFELTYTGTLSPATAGLEPVSAYEASTTVAPLDSGAGALFIYDGPQFSRVREAFVEGSSDVLGSVDISVQVPKYIPQAVFGATVSATESLLALVSGSDRDSLYIYKWFIDGGTRVQSAWSRWGFQTGVSVLNAAFLDEELYVVVTVEGDAHLLRIRVEETVFDVTTNVLLLDLKVDPSHCTLVYDAPGDQTTVTLPYSSRKIVEFWKTGSEFGEPLPATKLTDNSYIIDGDQTATSWQAGLPYEYACEVSEFFVRTNTREGVSVIQDGRLQLSRGSIIYQDTTYFTVEVNPDGRPVRTYIYNGMDVRDEGTELGSLPVQSGKFDFPIKASSDKVTITIKNDQPFPCSFGPLEWQGSFYPKAR